MSTSSVATERSVGRTTLLVSADADLRRRLHASLSALRWHVLEAAGGAEAMAELEASRPAVLLVDNWLPDLEVGEFAAAIRVLYPEVDLMQMDGVDDAVTTNPRRNELLHALREARETQAPPAWQRLQEEPSRPTSSLSAPASEAPTPQAPPDIPELIGRSPRMRELAGLIRLVAPRSTTVLIEGETGTGKEVVARALHRLGARVNKPFAVLNCAAIPEALLEAELFGHTRGAFTGAVQSRTGRIEAAHGGTLFLDEIGEMPLALQAKMLRFLECGELQRVGDNETLQVDVRIIAATHQPLERKSEERTFRLDLYHRLAVFPIEVPPLRERRDDIDLLAVHLLARLGREMPQKRLLSAALDRLHQHEWPGNVRELAHVLERGAILAGDQPEIDAGHIRFRRATQA